MDLCVRVEQILEQLRPVFSRQVPFRWLLLLVWGIILAERDGAVTGYLNALGVSQQYYHQALHWFNASSWSVQSLCQRWGEWLRTHPQAVRLRGRLVYVGDTVKVMKSGMKMPLVKKLKQLSQNVNKPQWIRGHHFGVVSLLMGQGEALFAVVLQAQVQEGLRGQLGRMSPLVLYWGLYQPQALLLLKWLQGLYAPFNDTLVRQMAHQSATLAHSGSIIILDAFYAAKQLLRFYREAQLFLISRVRINTCAAAPFCPLPGGKGKGRKRQWGSKIKLRQLFAEVEQFESVTLKLYGRSQQVRYRSFQLHWDSSTHLVQFVLSQLPSGQRLILISNDLELSGADIIQAYSWRFKIEVSFRTLIHLLDGFSYRFWLKALPKTRLWPKAINLPDVPWAQQQALLAKLEAFERFVNLHALVLGILQILALEFPQLIYQSCPHWFRSLPQHAFPSEQIVRLTLRHCLGSINAKIPPRLLLHQFLAALPSPRTDQHA
jgi:hypothetical protein